MVQLRLLVRKRVVDVSDWTFCVIEQSPIVRRERYALLNSSYQVGLKIN